MAPITRELRELINKAPRRPEIARVPRIDVKRDIESQPQSKRKLVATYGPLAETFYKNTKMAGWLAKYSYSRLCHGLFINVCCRDTIP